MKKRVIDIDVLRGVAVVLMIVFHFSYDLNYFGYIDIQMTKELFWVSFQLFIVSLFLLIVGVGLYLGYQNAFDLKKLLKRVLFLGVGSILITISTMYNTPNYWVYFGILHFILVASIVGVPFVKFPRTSLVIGILIVLGYNLKIIGFHWLFEILKPLLNLPNHTVDVVRFFPWFGVVLIGIFIGSKGWYNLGIKENRVTNIFVFIGKNALIIYLIHQPILFGFFMAYNKLFGDA